MYFRNELLRSMDLQGTKYDPTRFTFGTFLIPVESNVLQEGDKERNRNKDSWVMKKKDEADWEVETEEENNQSSRGDDDIQRDDLFHSDGMKRDEDSNTDLHSQGNDRVQSYDRSEDVESVSIRDEMFRSTNYPSMRKPVVESVSEVDRKQEDTSVNDVGVDISPNDAEMRVEEGDEGEKDRSTVSPTLPVLPFDQHYQLVLFTTVESFGKKVPFQSFHLHP